MIDTPLQSSGCSSPSLAARQEGQLHKGTALTTKTARTKNVSMCRKEKQNKRNKKKQSHIGAVIGLSNGTKSSLESAVLCLTCEQSVPGRSDRLRVPLQHVLVSWLVVVVPVVVEVRTVVGRRY